MSEVTDITEGLARRPQAAQTQAVSTIEDNPEHAQRAIELGDATGVPPTTIAGDLEGFEQKHRTALAGSIIKGNPHIQDYIMSHPMASKLSNDDYGNLDAVSQALGKFSPSGWEASRKGIPSVMGTALESFKTGYDKEGQEAEYAKAVNDPIMGPMMANPITGPALATLDTSMRFINGLIYGLGGAVGELSNQATGEPAWGHKLTRDLITFAQVGLAQHMATPEGLLHPKVREAINESGKLARAVAPYVESGEVPPVGVHPIIDDIHKQQSKLDLKNLDEAFKEAQASKTRERNPEMFAGYVKQHTDASIGISGDKVAELYGDKAPSADDGLLGHIVPDLAEQLAEARDTGGDVKVPLSEWLAKADPEMAKELHDHIRVRPEGLTKEEAKELKPEYPEESKVEEPKEGETAVEQVPVEPIQAAVDTIRQAAFPASAFDKYRERAEPIVPKGAKLGGSPVEIEGFKAQPLYTFDTDQALGFIKRDHLSDLSRQLYDLVGTKLSEMVGKVPVKVLSQEDIEKAYVADKPAKDIEGPILGLFLPGTREIALSEQIMGKPKTLSWTMFHEAVHAFTIEALFRDDKIAGHVQGLLNETSRFLKEVDPEAHAYHEYAFHNIDEFMSEAYSNPEFQEKLSAVPLPRELAEEMGLGKGKPTVWDGIRNLVKSLLEKLIGQKVGDNMIDAVLHMGKEIEQFNKDFVAEAKARRESAAATGKGPLDERDPFEKAASIGMTKDQLAHYEDLIAKRNAEDLAAAKTRAEKEQRKKQTDEWKRNTVEERKQAADDVNARPDVMADTFLRDKSLSTKLNPESLTPEQRKGLPKEYLSKDGISADEMASAFGYQTGDAMVAHLSAYNDQIKQSGMRLELFKRRLIEAETERRMQSKYGDLEKNILDEAKDQALSETQLDLLHEQTLAAATRAGAEFTLTKEQIKSGVQKLFGDKAVADVDSARYLADAGKAHRQANIHLLDGKFQESFRESQKGYLSTVFAQEAKKFEKEKATFDRTAKRFSKKEVGGVLPEYTNVVQDILTRIGKPVNRSIQGIADDLTKNGYKSLEDFVATKEAGFRDLHVPEFLADPNFRKRVNDMSVRDFREVNKAIKALAFNGRDELKLEKAGEAHDLREVIGEMKDQIKLALGEEPKVYPIDRPVNSAIDTAKSYWWSGITVESMLNRLDKGDPKGVFNQYIVRPFTQASNYKDRLIRDYQKQVSEIGKIADMDKLVDNTLFVDPITGDPFTMRRRNVLGILQNVGNPSNLTKLAKGYNLEAKQIMAWLWRNTSKEDWDRAQRIGDIFNELFDKADVMSHQISGVGMDKLPLEPVMTPHGNYKGWYNPVKYDPIRPGGSKKLLGAGIEDEGYYRATTPQGYTKERTGYTAPIELTLDIVPQRMKQMIHDIAMRPAVLQLAKVFYDREFKKAMIDHYGKHQAEEMIPFLRDMANSSNFKSLAEHMGNTALEYFRQNTIATLIGLNPGTVMKHGTTALFNSITQVGATNFAREFFTLVKGNEHQQTSNWKMAMDKSEELQRRMRNYQELISGHGSEINIRGVSGQTWKGKFMSVREFAMQAGATPVSVSDLLSAMPTWLAKYKDLIAKGEDEGSAVFEADRAVRQAHGSSVLTNKPAIMRTNALGAWFSSLYGFFSHMQQKQYEMAWKGKEALGLAKEGEVKEALKKTPELLGMFMSYVVIPAAIEELVTPYTNNEKDSWGKKAAKTLAMGVSSSFIGVRDFLHGFINVRDPSAGLVGTSLKAMSDVGRDLGKGVNKANAPNLIKHAFALNGILTGMTNAQEGKAMEYLYRYFHGQERPKGPLDVMKGLRHGKTNR